MSVSLSLSLPLFLSLHSVLFTSHSEQILRQAVWCSKQKGLKAFHQPPRLKTSPFKGKHKLAQEKLFTLDTNTGRLLPTDVANSLQIIQYAWNCRASTCWDEDNFAEGERLIIAPEPPFRPLHPQEFINFYFVPVKLNSGLERCPANAFHCCYHFFQPYITRILWIWNSLYKHRWQTNYRTNSFIAGFNCYYVRQLDFICFATFKALGLKMDCHEIYNHSPHPSVQETLQSPLMKSYELVAAYNTYAQPRRLIKCQSPISVYWAVLWSTAPTKVAHFNFHKMLMLCLKP